MISFTTMNPKPNFLIVGAPKCGTTALYKYIGSHPNVFMPEVKEPYYFVQPKEKIGEGPADLSYRNFVDSEGDYAELFVSVNANHQAIGEASAGYLYFHELAIPKIQKALGDPKIIILLRDPVARAFSSHVHHVRADRESEDFTTAWELQDERNRKGWWFGFQLKKVGLYADAVNAFQKSFSNVKVILNDDLRYDTAATVRSVFEFLKVESSFKTEVARLHNENLLPRSKKLQRRIVKLQHRCFLPGPMLKFLDQINSYRPVLDPEIAAMIAPEFREDLGKTSELIGRDLFFWFDRYQSG